MVLQSIFVIGSFSEGMVHYKKLANFVKGTRAAKARGSVYRLEVGFPVFLSEGNDVIEGHVLDLEAQEVLFQLMDEFHGFQSQQPEGSLFIRQPMAVATDQGEESVVVYALNPARLPKTAKQILGGDWQKSLQEQPPLTQKLTDLQKLYIIKLGHSSGRDIVPIKLDMYQELMRKGIIIDKGRRQALSLLGQEVFRFLL